jgi:hypothetical protein
MSAPNEMRPVLLDQQFWRRLDRIERHHQRIQSEHETWRRSLDRCRETQNADLRVAWQRYCEVIAELERTTAEFETLRVDPNSPCLSDGDHEAAFPSGARYSLAGLQAAVRELANDRNAALRLLRASRNGAVLSAQQDYWLEFSGFDQEYRFAIRKLAEFCARHAVAATCEQRRRA